MKVNLQRTIQTCNNRMWKVDESGKLKHEMIRGIGISDFQVSFCGQDDTGKCLFDGLNLWAIQRQVTMSCRI